MTDHRFVRARTSKLVHVTYDLRRTGCGRCCDGWTIEPEPSQFGACIQCFRVVSDIDERGN